MPKPTTEDLAMFHLGVIYAELRATRSSFARLSHSVDRMIQLSPDFAQDAPTESLKAAVASFGPVMETIERITGVGGRYATNADAVVDFYTLPPSERTEANLLKMLAQVGS